MSKNKNTNAAMYDEFYAEFLRVFGSCDVHADDPNAVIAEGWPDFVVYDDIQLATSILARFPSRYGEDECGDGDAEVCDALEAAGARIK